jgi:hypothetical protein
MDVGTIRKINFLVLLSPGNTPQLALPKQESELYFPIWPRVTPSWFISFNSRQSWVPEIKGREGIFGPHRDCRP